MKIQSDTKYFYTPYPTLRVDLSHKGRGGPYLFFALLLLGKTEKRFGLKVSLPLWKRSPLAAGEGSLSKIEVH
jgi:hypothetical protein